MIQHFKVRRLRRIEMRDQLLFIKNRVFIYSIPGKGWETKLQSSATSADPKS